MDINTLIIVVGFVLNGLILKSFLSKYMEEKGKNLATKEDIEDITQKTEKVKSEFNNRLAEFSKDLQLKLYLEQLVYENKFKVIQESLEFIDLYISWLTIYDSNKKINGDVVRKDVTVEELTLMGRKHYNNLCITCDNSEILSCFHDLIFNNEKEFEHYNRYRNLCRKELKINNEIEFDKDRVFYSIICTSNLKNKN